MGDIGEHFPPSDPAFKGIRSTLLLQRCYTFCNDAGYRIVNLDLTVLAERPYLAPFRLQMRQSLAEILGCDLSQVSVKATTAEGLGFLGRGEGICAIAVVLLTENV